MRHLVFFRSINVGGHAVIPMADLRSWLEKQGCAAVRSLLQSGNFVVNSPRPPAVLERELESAAARELGLATSVFVRTADEWQDAIAGNPFASEARSDPSHLVLVLLKGAPSVAALKTLRAAIIGRETVHSRGRHAYVYYPDGIGRSRLALTVIEKALGTSGTARNWGTVLKLADLAGAEA